MYPLRVSYCFAFRWILPRIPLFLASNSTPNTNLAHASYLILPELAFFILGFQLIGILVILKHKLLLEVQSSLLLFAHLNLHGSVLRDD